MAESDTSPEQEVEEWRQKNPITLKDVRELLPHAPHYQHASALLDLNGCPMPFVEAVLSGLAELASLCPLNQKFFLDAIVERRKRHVQFFKDLMTGKLDDV